MERKNIFLIIAIVLVAAGIFVIKRFMSDSSCQKFDFAISSNSVLVGESIHFEDKTMGANVWSWNFGEGEGTSEDQSGDYTFKTGGDKVITLTIGKCSEQFSIKVAVPYISSEDTTQKAVIIIGQASCFVGDNVSFKNTTEGATKWEWQFGESGGIDKFDQNPSYTYNRPGKYTIVLRVDASKGEGRLEIKVNSKPVVTGGGAPPLPPQLTGPQLKAKLEAILLGKFDAVFDPMLKQYFCNNSSIPVSINGGNTTSIYSYCMKLDLKPDTKINDVKVEYDTKTNCVSKVTITE